MFTKKELIRMLIPLIIEQLLSVVIGITGIFMVSGLGEAAMSGVSNVDTFNTLILQVFTTVSTGGAIVCAQYLGRSDDNEEVNIAARQLLIIITGFSVLISVVCILFSQQILQLIYPSAAADVSSYSNIYLVISAFSFPAMAVYNIGAALFRVQGNSKVSMYVSFIMNIANIIFNALLINTFQMGVAGAAWGSVISRSIGAVMLFILLRKNEGRIHLRNLRATRLDFAMIKRILHISVPNGVENLIFQVGKIMVQGIVASFGIMANAAHSIGNITMSIGYMPGNAVGIAILTVVGQCVGAGEYDQAEKYTYKLTKFSYIVMAGVNIIMVLCLNPLIAAFHLTGDTARLAWEICALCAVFTVFAWPAAFCIPSGLRAASDVMYPMVLSIISMWVFRVGCSVLLGKVMGMGLMGVWIAMGLDWSFRAVIYWFRLRSNKWKLKKALI